MQRLSQEDTKNLNLVILIFLVFMINFVIYFWKCGVNPSHNVLINQKQKKIELLKKLFFFAGNRETDAYYAFLQDK